MGKDLYKKKRKRKENKIRKMKSLLNLKDQSQDDEHSANDTGPPAKKSKVQDESVKADTSGDITDEELARLRAEKRARQKASMQRPKVFLTTNELRLHPIIKAKYQVLEKIPAEEGEEEERAPLFVMDLQHLLLYAMVGDRARYVPRWCKLLRWTKISRVVAIVIDGVSEKDYEDNTESFQYTKSTFEISTQMTSPELYGRDALTELLAVPMSNNEIKLRGERPLLQMSTETSAGRLAGPMTLTRITRLDLLLNPWQMVAEKFPMPDGTDNTKGYVYTTVGKYAPVKKTSPMFGLDCEMCVTSLGKLELTRVSVVNEKLECVYDTLVKPYNTITSYLTQYSGITAKMLKNVKTRLHHVQKTIQKLLPPDAILVGQSLNGDLHQIKMFHPYVIDTSVVYNLSGQRSVKPGLKKLAAYFLEKKVQQGNDGHSPIEDSATSLELILHKLEKGYLEYGDVTLGWTPHQAKWEETVRENSRTKTDAGFTFRSFAEAKKPEKEKESKEESKQEVDASTKRSDFFSLFGAKKHVQSLVDIAWESGKSVHLVGNNDKLKAISLPANKAKGWASAVRYTKTSRDAESAGMAADDVSDNFFSLVHLNGSAGQADKEGLQMIDDCVRHLVDSLPSKALVTVLLGGRCHGDAVQNALCLLKVT